MPKTKTFDCVVMKNRIQDELRKEYEGLSDSEIAERRLRLLETSDAPLARKWRQLEADSVSPGQPKP